jgi:uncharacterized protein (DUF362 family)
MKVDRRRFLGALAGLPLLGGLTSACGQSRSDLPGPPPSPRSAPASPLVARARREGVIDKEGSLQSALLEEMTGASVARAAGEETPLAAMKVLFRPTDVVGLKLNCLAGRGLSPRPGLVDLLTGWLQEAGVPASNIVVWERSERELARAGYRVNRSGAGVRVLGTENDYDWTPREWGPGGSCFANLLVKDLTALINVGVLKDHDLSGVSVGMKNWYGVIHNPNKHHADGCHPFVAHLSAYPLIRDKLRLTVIDGIDAQCHGGPARNPRWRWPWRGVMASTDHVALDAIGWRMIEERRKEAGLKTLAEEERAPRWIATASEIGLGAADPAKIEVVDL